MLLCVVEFRKRIKRSWTGIGVVVGVVFLGLSVLIYSFDVSFKGMNFLLGIIACIAVILIIAGTFQGGNQNIVFGFLAKYTMPIFVMHTLFAAPLRSVLLKLGIGNAVIHVVLGIAISFIGPIIAAWIMEKTVYLEFFLYPWKVINRVKRSH